MNSTGTTNVAHAVVCAHLRVDRGGRTVLDDVSCVVRTGTVTGLLGPNGSGKSTLIRCVLGIQRVAAGSVTVLSRPAGSRELRDQVGYATQQPAVYADLTVRENLHYFATVLGAPKDDPDRVIDQVRLADCAHLVAGRLSGGQASRVNLAVALLGSPRLLVLDEPTVGTDPELREQLWRMFGSLAANGITVLISSHIMGEAARCGRLLLLRDGHLLTDTTPDGLLAATGEDTLEAAFLTLVRSVDEDVVPQG